MRHAILLLSLLSLFMLQACGGESSAPQPAGQTSESSGLTAAELENGLGPVKSLTLTDIDAQLAEQGSQIYSVKCSACHKMTERYVGPPLGDVLNTRSPAYVMNMILNPDEMIQKHPEARKLYAQFMTPMANQNLTEAEARAVVEYLRTQQTN